MGFYNTRQKERILSFLGLHVNEELTVHEIVEGISKGSPNEEQVAESTVYRIMNNLTKLGLTSKKTDSNREFRYRLCNSENSIISFHCKVCGKIYNIDEKVCNSIIKELHENCPVMTDEELMLTGVCDNCK
ncbi:transcriptional repressor [Ruminococcus sp.]|uniref:transcriptional repressor n=1 Tax=Ruminococcus sp. TaxID=41978 RepID=UPI0025D7E989|nr:transcriptional repressor [Ruminococcus sp.]